MKCFLTLLKDATKDCLGNNCSVWDSDHNSCLITSYLQGYIKQQNITVEMLRVAREIRKHVDDDYED